MEKVDFFPSVSFLMEPFSATALLSSACQKLWLSKEKQKQDNIKTIVKEKHFLWNSIRLCVLFLYYISMCNFKVTLIEVANIGIR